MNFRANYIAFLWKNSHLRNQDLTQISESGWKLLENGSYLPIGVTKPPAPEGILELVHCSCKKGCSTRACSCRKNSVHCAETCSCTEFGCQNVEDLAATALHDELPDENNDSDYDYGNITHINNNKELKKIIIVLDT